MAQNPQQEQWERIFKQKQRELLANSSPGALQVNNFDELSTGLHSLATSYRSTGFPSFVSRLGPSFEQVKTFTAAITSACQYEPRACLVWGAMQALVQVRTISRLGPITADKGRLLAKTSMRSTRFLSLSRISTSICHDLRRIWIFCPTLVLCRSN